MPNSEETTSLSPWWRHAAILVMIAGFAGLSYLTVRTYTDAPPIPDRVEDASGRTLFTSADILRGQEVFLKYGLMEHGTLWGHGAYLGPDYSADTLHQAVEVGRDTLARERYGRPFAVLEDGPAAEIAALVRRTLKGNRYDPSTGVLRFTEIEAAALAASRQHWGDYFSGPTAAARLADEVHPRAPRTRGPRRPISPGPPGLRSPTDPARTTPTPTTGPTTRPPATRPAARRSCGVR